MMSKFQPLKFEPNTEQKSPSRYMNIVDLNNYITSWTIQVRITNKSAIREFQSASRSGRLFSVIMQDHNGDTIKGTAFSSAVDKFYDVFEVNKTYQITGGKIQAANKKYNTTNSDFEITFMDSTIVEPLEENITMKYNFIPIKEMAPLKQSTSVDVIGIMTKLEPIFHFQDQKGNSRTKRILEICDKSEAKIDITLWGKEAEEFQEISGNPVIAIKGALISHFSGTSLSLSSSSIMVIDPKDLPEADQLRIWWKNEIESKTESFSNLIASQSPNYTEGTLSSLYCSEKSPSYFSVYGILIDIPSGRKMFYLGCPNKQCRNKGVIEAPDGTYTCPNCKKIIAEPIPRYLFSFKIADFSMSSFCSVIGDEKIGKIILNKTIQEWVTENSTKEDIILQNELRMSYFKTFHLKIRAKTEEYQGITKTKLTATEVTDADFVDGAKMYLSEIFKYNQ